MVCGRSPLCRCCKSWALSLTNHPRKKILSQVVKGIACPPLCTLFCIPTRTGGYTTQARHDGDVLGVVAPSMALTMPPFPSDSPSKAAATSIFFAPAEIILALGPSTELDVSAAAISLAWVLAVIVGGWGGGGTSGESVIDVGGMVWRCWRWMRRQRRRWR